MALLLFPEERALRFAFEGEACLYRDHEGRRVVADVEGAGFFEIETAEPSLTVVRGANEDERFPRSFRDGLLVLCDAPGTVSVAVGLGRRAPAEGRAEIVALPFEGQGWVFDADGPIAVDGRHEPAPKPSPRLPAPFFRRVDGLGTATVLRADGPRCEPIDAFDVADADALRRRRWKVQNMSRLNVLASAFADGTTREAAVASHLNAASWRVAVPSGCRGLILRKFYDRFHGRQRVRVFLDDAFAGWWYEAGENRRLRWAVSDFGVPGQLVEGKAEVTVTLDPPAGAALWSVGRMEVFGLF